VTEDEFIELAAGHALHALDATEEEALEAAMLQHPGWVRHVTAALETSARLADLAEPIAPPPSVRSELLARIAEPALPLAPPAAADPAVEPPRRLLRRWLALAASIVVIAGVAVGSTVFLQQTSRPASIVALEQIDAAPDADWAAIELEGGGAATAHWSTSVGQAVLVVDGLPAPGSDQTFELWYVGADGPVPAGTFMTDTNGAATALLAGTFEPGLVIAVTVEPAGGSPTGAPSSDPVVAIAT
jgi:anti-sigma-K factor RskA